MKRLFAVLFALVISAALLCSCGGVDDKDAEALSDWEGHYVMMDVGGNTFTLEVKPSEYESENPGELYFSIGENFSGLETPADGTISTELLDGSGTATLTLSDDGNINVTYDGGESEFAPPVGIYIKQ
ncbi:MAG: hypothetical protein WCQ72_03910 [Eubacteriales bacterium]